MEAEIPIMEGDDEQETAVRIKAEKEVKKREKDAAGARRMKERFSEARAASHLPLCTPPRPTTRVPLVSGDVCSNKQTSPI